eukprot:CAMPEP_0176448478 /NCGR_PEP_ID=MMETSP0127-20121128/25807_1 /TAXON_ID=938130 /ORGANISM="Platyophrya macrostoma, Strain WH" /LENGTH=150 /DNA_ID=CAMNT_0017835435 /DNA_START=47 /DNA_END=495 /DNA_ORIENTATION=-
MSVAVGLGELTQATLNRLRGAEFHMRIVQLQPSGASLRGSSSTSQGGSSSEIDGSVLLWRSKYGSLAGFPSLTLPSVLVEYYKVLQSDGLYFGASVSRGASAGSGVEPSSFVCCCRLNPISQIVPMHGVDHRHLEPMVQASSPSVPRPSS